MAQINFLVKFDFDSVSEIHFRSI